MTHPEPDGKMDIRDIPYHEKKQICIILDQDKKWKPLALEMSFDEFTIDTKLNCERLKEKSPSDELLTMWAYYEHEVLELFVLLERVGAYNCMIILKKYVPIRHHRRIKQENNLGMQKPQITNSKVAKENFAGNTSKGGTNKNLLVPPETRDNNESTHNNTQNPKNNNISFNNLRVPSGVQNGDLLKFLDACVVENAGSTPQIPYEELQQATNNWTELLGSGGFGKVFKGKWKFTDVAVKRLEPKNESTTTNEHIRQSIIELRCLNRYRHDNILAVYGYSVGGPHPCLVYQYMKNGSLDFRLRGSSQKTPQHWLSWCSRLNIAIGVSRGLQYLHTVLTDDNKPLVHCDMKSANILLDNQDHPRIGDFGLARKGPEISQENMEISRIQGTRPYLPADFMDSRQFSVKVDVYSFGVVLFELATGLAPYYPTRRPPLLKSIVDTYQGNILDLKDKRVVGGDFVYVELVRIGKKCVAKYAAERPHMVQVLEELEKAEELKS